MNLIYLIFAYFKNGGYHPFTISYIRMYRDIFIIYTPAEASLPALYDSMFRPTIPLKSYEKRFLETVE